MIEFLKHIASRGIAAARQASAAVRAHSSITLVVVWSTLVAMAFVATYGSLMIASGLIIMTFVAIITLYRLEWGFYVFIGSVLLLDQHGIPGFDPFTLRVDYFSNLNAIAYLPSVSFLTLNPMEVHLLFIFLVWLTQAALRRRFELTPVNVWFPTIVFYGMLVFGIVYGRARGGDMVIALWESRGLFYLGILYIFAAQLIQTPQQLKDIFWVCIGAITIKAFQGILRFAELGFNFSGLDTFTNHEDPVFIVTLFILLMGLAVFGGYRQQYRSLRWLLFPLFLGYYVGNRRATYVSLLVAVIAVLVMMSPRERKPLMKGVMIFAVFFSVYLGVFWNAQGALGMMAQKFKSMVFDSPDVSARDYSSTLYRKYEDYNLAVTFTHNPVIGIGYGVKYEMPISIFGFDKMERSIFAYIPHNQIIWMGVKIGAIGFFAFFFFLNSFLVRGASVYRALRNPYMKALCLVCVTAVLNQVVVSYVDMQLTYYRNMVYLGLLMGLVPVLERCDASAAEEPVPELSHRWSSAQVSIDELIAERG